VRLVGYLKRNVTTVLILKIPNFVHAMQLWVAYDS